MAVLIDMEMPTGCHYCPCSFRDPDYDAAWCQVNKRSVYGTTGRPELCPLVEIQVPRQIMPGVALEAAGFEL